MMRDEDGRLAEIPPEVRAAHEAAGRVIFSEGEHVVLKGREFVIEEVTEETLRLRPVRQLPARTLPGPIPSTRVPFHG